VCVFIFEFLGRGHPGEDRRVPLSEARLNSMYLRRSGAFFLKHSTFALVAFDRTSRIDAMNAIRLVICLLRKGLISKIGFLFFGCVW